MSTKLLNIKVEAEMVIAVEYEGNIYTDDHWEVINTVVKTGLEDLISRNNIHEDFDISWAPITHISSIPSDYEGDEIPYSNIPNSTLNILDILSLSKKS